MTSGIPKNSTFSFPNLEAWEFGNLSPEGPDELPKQPNGAALWRGNLNLPWPPGGFHRGAGPGAQLLLPTSS